MLFTAFLDQITAEPSVVEISPDWMQGRAGYGGLVAALVYESMRKQLLFDAPVRCLQISFVGPVSSGPLTLESEVLRQGKSVSHVLGRGIQDGECKVIVQGSFGAARESLIDVSGPAPKVERVPELCKKLPYSEGVTPAFTRHFDYRYATQFPFSASKDQHLQGYLRFAEPEPVMTTAHLIGLVDGWPPTTLPMFEAPAMACSLSWTIEFVHPAPALGLEEYILYEADIVQSANGYGHTRALIWNESEQLLAISQQTVTHFA